MPEGAAVEAEDVHAVTVSTAAAMPSSAETIVLIQHSPAAASTPVRYPPITLLRQVYAWACPDRSAIKAPPYRPSSEDNQGSACIKVFGRHVMIIRGGIDCLPLAVEVREAMGFRNLNLAVREHRHHDLGPNAELIFGQLVLLGSQLRPRATPSRSAGAVSCPVECGFPQKLSPRARLA